MACETALIALAQDNDPEAQVHRFRNYTIQLWLLGKAYLPIKLRGSDKP